MIKAIRDFFYKRALMNQKRRALFEVGKDLEYIKVMKGDMLKYDESKARKRMKELKTKENRTETEEAELDKVIEVITESKSVKNEYEQSSKLQRALQDYIKVLR